MKSMLLTLATLFALFATLTLNACGNEIHDSRRVVFDDPVPVTGTVSTVNVDLDKCLSDDDCSEVELCELYPEASSVGAGDIYTCQLGCDVSFEETRGEDGSYIRTPVDDTCQRNGDADLFCDPDTSRCRERTTEDGNTDCVDDDCDGDTDGNTDCVDDDCDGNTDDPDDPTPTPCEGDCEVVSLELVCCYDSIEDYSAQMRGQFSWSEATETQPDAWGAGRDLPIDSDGCFRYEIEDRTVVYRNFWVDMTEGIAETGRWVGDALAPRECWVNGRRTTQFDFTDYRGWYVPNPHSDL